MTTLPKCWIASYSVCLAALHALSKESGAVTAEVRISPALSKLT